MGCDCAGCAHRRVLATHIQRNHAHKLDRGRAAVPGLHRSHRLRSVHAGWQLLRTQSVLPAAGHRLRRQCDHLHAI